MRTHFLKRNLFLGLLMTCVMTLGVLSTADALTFGTSRSGDFQTALPNEPFTISFSVSLGSNTTAIRNADGKLVNDTDARIDSSGYLVAEIDGREYRTVTGVPAGTLVIDPRPTYDDETPADAGTPAPDYYVDSSRNVVDSNGAAVYVQTGTGVRADSSPWRYTRAKMDPNDKVSDANRYHYNQEAITVSVPASTRLTKVGSYDVNIAGDATHAMNELKGSVNQFKLSSTTIRLTYTATAAGEYTFTITDTTPETDRPVPAATALTFTVYVVNLDSTVASLGAAAFEFNATQGTEVDGRTRVGNRSAQRPQPIAFTLTGSPNTHIPLLFKVEGGGQVYARETGRATDADREGPRSSGTREFLLSSAAEVYLDMKGRTNKVTVRISGTSPEVTGETIIYVHDYARLAITHGAENQEGAPGGRLEEPLRVKVTDSSGTRAVPGAVVRFPAGTTETDANGTFIPVPGTTVYVNASNVLVSSLATAATNEEFRATSIAPAAATAIYVKTDAQGIAEVYYSFGTDVTPGQKTITAGLAHNATVTRSFPVTAVRSTRSASLVLVSGDNQHSDPDTHTLDEPLVVRVRQPGGLRIAGVTIRFTGIGGTLEAAPGTNYVAPDGTAYTGTANPIPDASIKGTQSGEQIYVITNAHGEAAVTYSVGQIAGAKTVMASVDDEQADSQYDFQVKHIEFSVDGSGSSRDPDPDPDPDPPPAITTLTVPSSISGAPGSTQTLSGTASGTVFVGALTDSFGTAGGIATTPSRTGTSFTSTLTLPSTVGTYSLTVSSGQTTRTVTVTVASPQVQTGELTLTSAFSGAPGSQSTVTVKATHADGTAASGVSVRLSVSSGGGTFLPATVTTRTDGTAISTFTRGTTAGTNYFITASASDYDSVQQRISITGTPPGSIAPPAGAVGEADAIDVYDGDNQRGTPNTRLAEPLVVEVVDANDDAVANERVEFRTTRGTGWFSPSRPRTDANGLAQTRFTPTSSGTIRITASVEGVASRAVFTITTGAPAAALTKVSGDSQSGTPGNALTNPFVVEVKDTDGEMIEGIPVTFSVTEGGGSLSETSVTTDEDGHASTTLTLGSRTGVNSVQASVPGVEPVTFSTSIEPKVLVAAANRPVLYWSDGGTVYQLAGATTTKLADNVNGFTVGGGKVYWTTQTGPSAGSIHSANLDGTGATTLNSIMAVPMGIAVDTAGSKLYWTNSRGRVQSANLNGKSIQNLVQNRTSPTDLVLGGGYIYWIEDGNSIRRAPMTGQKTVTDVAVNLSDVGGIAVSGSKVYWTEQTGASSGTVNGADLDGTNFSTLATLLAAPMGIAVDTAGSKLYWTNSRGRVQSANRDGSKIRNVVEGLISPSKLVIRGANTAVVAQQQPTQPAAPAKDTSAYDVNGDGKVDNVDAGLVADALGTSNATYDVNGDGTVNFLDLLLVFDNREDAAGAPTILGLKMTATHVEVLQEQIDLLIATGDRSPTAMRTLVYLQQLLATARPEKTQLLANYPNPFNPETWIPYQLATDTDVRITIYNAQGVVIRTLQLGQQSAGYYTDRERAAYWDGRNALGEQVASGIYFYQLETDEMSSLRKMVILK